MRPGFDFAPLFRSSVGFDRMLDALRDAPHADPMATYPPCDIERAGKDTYQVTLAVAGFRPEDLTVTAQPGLLVVAGEQPARAGAANDNEARHRFLHRGIATRAFSRRFALADHIEVVGARLADGLLTIELRREVPEAMRPRRIEIGGAPPRRIEATQVA